MSLQRIMIRVCGLSERLCEPLAWIYCEMMHFNRLVMAKQTETTQTPCLERQ